MKCIAGINLLNVEPSAFSQIYPSTYLGLYRGIYRIIINHVNYLFQDTEQVEKSHLRVTLPRIEIALYALQFFLPSQFQYFKDINKYRVIFNECTKLSAYCIGLTNCYNRKEFILFGHF